MEKNFWKFLTICSLFAMVTVLTIVFVNNYIDASGVIHPQHQNKEMSRLALEGNIVTTPQNYNERVYQVFIVEQMEDLPETVVLGSSRGMYLGKEITGYNNLYNNCVSGACLEDYYAILGLYYNRFGEMPKRVIVETDPWVLYEGNPESRWTEYEDYMNAALEFYEHVNNEGLSVYTERENPYVSLSYFQYNISQIVSKGIMTFINRKDAKISIDPNEAAEYPDGSIRCEASVENESETRLEGVQRTSGACTYKNVNLMEECDEEKIRKYESLVDYLIDNECEVIIYLQPFSATQCKYSIDQKLNPGFELAEEYLNNMAQKRNIHVIGYYDARKIDLMDVRFIDFMHLDKIGTGRVWNYR